MVWKQHPIYKNYMVSEDNLEWLSSSENIKHAFQNGFVKTCHPTEIDGVTYYSKLEVQRKTGLNRFAL